MVYHKHYVSLLDDDSENNKDYKMKLLAKVKHLRPVESRHFSG